MSNIMKSVINIITIILLLPWASEYFPEESDTRENQPNREKRHKKQKGIQTYEEPKHH